MDGTVGAALREARRRLAAAPFEISTREAALLLGHLLGWSEAQVRARSEQPLAPANRERFVALLERRLAGEPAAYLIGEREFYGRGFRVDDRVLIPRPETEHLVDAAREIHRQGLLPPVPRLLDVGTGSGCLAVTLALEIPDARVLGSDLSLSALAVARANACRHGVSDRLRLTVADLLAAIRLASFDLVVSNPPYVAPEDASKLSSEIRDFEPAAALFAPDHGLAVLHRLLQEARRLRPEVRLLVEIGFGQLEGLGALARRTGWEVVRAIPDYAGIPRTVVLARADAGSGKG